jgi:hypothetical protein
MPKKIKKSDVQVVEVEPIRFYTEGGQKFAEVTTPKRAQMWGVYLRLKHPRATPGLAHWVKDHKTKRAALAHMNKLALKYGIA